MSCKYIHLIQKIKTDIKEQSSAPTLIERTLSHIMTTVQIVHKWPHYKITYFINSVSMLSVPSTVLSTLHAPEVRIYPRNYPIERLVLYSSHYKVLTLWSVLHFLKK